MAAARDPTKQLRIKLGVAKRTAKELKMYMKEVDRERAKLAAMQEEGRDEYDIKQQTSVVSESEMMVPNTERRLQSAADALQEVVSSLADDPVASASAMFKEAEALLAELNEDEEQQAAGGGDAGDEMD